jgi:hypothetical protein
MLELCPDVTGWIPTYTVHATWRSSATVYYDYSPNSGASWVGEMPVPSRQPSGTLRPALRALSDDRVWLCKLNNPTGGYQGVELAVQRARPPQPGEEFWRYEEKGSENIWPKALATTLSSGAVGDNESPGDESSSETDGQPMVYLVTTRQSTSPPVSELWFMAFDTLQLNPYYQAVLATAPSGHDFQPSISHTPGDYVHIAYRSESGRIWYRTWSWLCRPDWIRQGAQPIWDSPYPISSGFYEPASEPSIDAYGDSVYCAWRGPNELGQQVGEVYQAKRSLFNPAYYWIGRWNVSQSPYLESGSPQCHTRTTVVWQEQVSGPQGAFEAMVRWTPGPIMQLSASPGHDSRWPHVAVVNPVPWGGLRYETYALWSDKDRSYPSADSIRFRRYVYIPNLDEQPEYPSYLAATLGTEEQSPYCRSRDGFRRYPEAGVDFARNALAYRLPYLDPRRDYQAELVVFNGEQEAITQAYSFGNRAAGSVTVQAGAWDTVYVPIPRAAYRSTTARLAVARQSGPLAALAGLKVYETSFGPGRDGPQAMPAGSPVIVRAEPNPFTGQCRISLAPGLGGAEVTVHDVSGRVVRTLAGTAGSVVWDGLNSEGRKLPAGVYYARVSAGTGTSCVKLVKR